MLLRFRDDVGAHVLGETEVVLLGEEERIVLSGKVYSALAPLLDGTRDADDIIRALDGIAPALAYYAIERLKKRGFVVEAAPGGPADGAVTLTVQCIGIEAEAGPALAAKVGSLHRAVTVVLVDDYLRPELAEQIAARPQDALLLPVRPVGLHAWFGPLIGPGADAVDWPALVARLRMNRPADAAVLDAGVPLPFWAPRVVAQNVDLALSYAANIVARAVAADDPSVASCAIITLDSRSLQVTRHALPKPMGAGRRPERIALAEGVKQFRADGGHRTTSPQETYERLLPLVSPITGIFPGLERLEAPHPLHVYGTAQRFAVPREPLSRNRLIGSVSSARGKGESDVQARVSCLAEAIERFSCSEWPDPSRRRATMAEIGDAAIHPNAILRFSDAQYAARHDPPPFYEPGGFNGLVAPFDPSLPIEWTPVWSLSHERTRYVPSAMCHFAYRQSGGEPFAAADSNGCAAGNTLEEAILQGLFELIERDACALWWYNRIPRPGIALASFGHPYFERAQELYADLGRTLVLIDLTTDLGVTAVAAISADGEGRDIDVAFGCHLDGRLAVSRAICELNQIVPVARPRDAPLKLDATVRHFKETVATDDAPYLVPSDAPQRTADDLADQSTPTLRGDIELIVGRLRAADIETLVLDQTRPDVGFPVARVFAPGLRHFWGRLGPGRLYDVPVAMGWLERPTAEADLNPIPFFW